MSKQEKKESKCIHDRLEYLGDQRGEGCQQILQVREVRECADMSEDGTWYEVPASKHY